MVVVLADDLSGAAELAGAALLHGLSAEVQGDFDPSSTADVLCVDTDTRSLDRTDAERLADEVARGAAAAKPAWIYKKCDSVLRGHVLAEARAIARATHAENIIVLSANPSRDRVIRGGIYYVEGRALEETVFAHDPEYPRHTSTVAHLLGKDLAGVLLPDAASSADVMDVAERTPPTSLAVGGVDYFEALLACRLRPRSTQPSPHVGATTPSPATRRLLVCGSAASWARRCTLAARRSIPILAMPHDIAAARGQLRAANDALIGIGDHRGATSNRASPALAAQLADAVWALLQAEPVAHLLLEGGATAKAVVRRMGWNRLHACAIAPAGTGVFTPADASGPQICIKPGSYPWPSELWPG